MVGMSDLVPHPTANDPPPRIIIQPSQDPHWEDRERARAAARQIAWLFDSAFVVPGTNFRIGLDPLIGLIPAYRIYRYSLADGMTIRI